MRSLASPVLEGVISRARSPRPNRMRSHACSEELGSGWEENPHDVVVEIANQCPNPMLTSFHGDRIEFCTYRSGRAILLMNDSHRGIVRVRSQPEEVRLPLGTRRLPAGSTSNANLRAALHPRAGQGFESPV